jgi:hypothetical protein
VHSNKISNIHYQNHSNKIDHRHNNNHKRIDNKISNKILISMVPINKIKHHLLNQQLKLITVHHLYSQIV